MIYTDEMYNEDLRISNFIFRKKFRSLISYKDDLIQCSLMHLYRYRDKYDINKSKYISYACKIGCYGMLNFLKLLKKQTNDNSNLSLDFQYDEKQSLYSELGVEYNFDSKFNFEFLKQICKKIILKQKKIKVRNIIILYLNCNSCAQVAQRLNLSRQYIWECVERFKELVKQKLKDIEYF